MALFGYPNTVGVDTASYLIICFYNVAVSVWGFFLKTKQIKPSYTSVYPELFMGNFGSWALQCSASTLTQLFMFFYSSVFLT